MKRTLCAALALALLCALLGCSGAGPAATGGQATDAPQEAKGLQVGFAEVNVTPKESVPMDGYSSSAERMSTGFTSYLYTMAVAATDSEGNTALLISVDACVLDLQFYRDFLNWVESSLSIPKENVVLSATHQHSCVDIDSSVPSAQRYRQQLVTGLKQVAQDALADRAPAEMYINTVQTEAMNFVRHYWANDGTMFGDNYGSMASGLARHESDADPEMRMVKFTRGDEKDIVLVNFQVHPHMGGGGQSSTNLHSDWPGIMRDTVAKELDAHCLYFSGAGGNLNCTTLISGEAVSKDYKDHGARAARYVLQAEGTYQKVDGDRIRGTGITATYEINHDSDHMYNEAARIHNARSVSVEAARAELAKYPQFHSIYHASAVASRRDMMATQDLTVSMVAFGDVLFAALPYEMFYTNGMELRQGTVGNPNYTAEEQLENPFKMTVIASLANGYYGYIPSQMNFNNGGYSVDICRFVAGTGERIVGKMLAAAQDLYK